MNSKLTNSNIVECVPQDEGKCRYNCPECFFNQFSADYKLPIWPTSTKVIKVEKYDSTIVRVNTVHDSSTLTSQHIRVVARSYNHFFYNTRVMSSILTLSPYPVVLSLWSNEEHNTVKLTEVLEQQNLMAVRIRFSWPDDGPELRRLIELCGDWKVKVILTVTRFIDNPHRRGYVCEPHINHWYFQPSNDTMMQIRNNIAGYCSGVRICGWPSPFCADCGTCEQFYWDWKRRNGNV